MYVLNSNAHPGVISWLPHGRGFIITDKKRLETDILPRYFKVSKFTSFTRRLNRWEFTIHTMGHKKSSYFHPKFVRHDPRQCLEMFPAPQHKKKSSDAIKNMKKKKKKEETLTKKSSPIDKSSDKKQEETATTFKRNHFLPPYVHDANADHLLKADMSLHPQLNVDTFQNLPQNLPQMMQRQQVLYNLSNTGNEAVQPQGFYNIAAANPGQMMAVEHAYLPNTVMTSNPYALQPQPVLSLPQGYSYGVEYQNPSQHSPSALIVQNPNPQQMPHYGQYGSMPVHGSSIVLQQHPNFIGMGRNNPGGI